MKKCIKGENCIIGNVKQPLSNFYAHKKMKDGHIGKCKECAKKDTKDLINKKKNDPIWIEKERKRNKERASYSDVIKYRKQFPEKYQAHCAAQRIKPKIKGNHNHHWNYNYDYFKDVIELTPKEHMQAHRFMIYDLERKMYRSLDGILLDTKERHLEYIKSIKETP